MNNEKTKTGTTTVGLSCKDGVVLASESQASMGNLISSKTAKKVFKIDDTIGLTISGGVGDAQNLIRILKAETKLYRLQRNRNISVKACNTLVSNILQSNRYYPLMAMLIIGGHDRKGFQLYSVDPLGGSSTDDYIATGSGSPVAYGVLEAKYEKGMDVEEGKDLAYDAIKSAMERETFTGGKKIQMLVIGEGSSKLVEKEINNPTS